MRKNNIKNKYDDISKTDLFEDLLVFGYHSKLFRDDDEAINIDLGRHLIPWAGDNSVLIDR